MKYLKKYENVEIDPFNEEDWNEKEIEKKYVKNEPGYCSACGSDMLEYDDEDLDGDTISYMWVCDDCGFQGYESFKLEFISQYSDNGKPTKVGGDIDEDSYYE